MCHSLIGADRRTHGKIVAIALTGAISLVVVTGAAWRTETDAPTAHARVNAPVLKAGKPAISAAAALATVRECRHLLGGQSASARSDLINWQPGRHR